MHFFLQRETLVIVQFRLGIFFLEVIGSEGQSDAFARLEPLHRPFEPLDWSLCWVLSLLSLVVFLYFVIVCCFEASCFVVICFCWLFCCGLFLLVILFCFVFVGSFWSVLSCFSVSCLFVWLCFVLFVILLFILFCFVC